MRLGKCPECGREPPNKEINVPFPIDKEIATLCEECSITKGMLYGKNRELKSTVELGKKHKIKELTLTCERCPTQWEGLTDENLAVYIRFRHGVLSVTIADTIDNAVMRVNEAFALDLQFNDHLAGVIELNVVKLIFADTIDFTDCKMLPPNINFYSFESSKRVDECEISADRLRILDWETYKPFNFIELFNDSSKTL